MRGDAGWRQPAAAKPPRIHSVINSTKVPPIAPVVSYNTSLSFAYLLLIVLINTSGKNTYHEYLRLFWFSLP